MRYQLFPALLASLLAISYTPALAVPGPGALSSRDVSHCDLSRVYNKRYKPYLTTFLEEGPQEASIEALLDNFDSKLDKLAQGTFTLGDVLDLGMGTFIDNVKALLCIDGPKEAAVANMTCVGDVNQCNQLKLKALGIDAQCTGAQPACQALVNKVLQGTLSDQSNTTSSNISSSLQGSRELANVLRQDYAPYLKKLLKSGGKASARSAVKATIIGMLKKVVKGEPLTLNDFVEVTFGRFPKLVNTLIKLFSKPIAAPAFVCTGDALSCLRQKLSAHGIQAECFGDAVVCEQRLAETLERAEEAASQ